MPRCQSVRWRLYESRCLWKVLRRQSSTCRPLKHQPSRI